MKIKQVVAVVATVAAIPFCHAADRYVASTAPDALSREVLSQPLHAFSEGATSPSDIPAAIGRNFPKLIEQSVASMPVATAGAWLDQLSDLEVEHLAQLYVNANADLSRSGKLLQLMALRMDGARLARLSRYFGFNEVYAAVQITAPSKLDAFASRVHTAYAAPVAGAMLSAPPARPGMVSTMAGFTPSTSMTLEQLYAGFRSMQIGSMGATAAVYEVGMYAGKNLAVAWGLGYAFGSGITYLMQEYTPDFYYNSFVPVVGGTISAAVNYVQNTVTTTYNDFGSAANTLGQFQNVTLPIFGVSPSIQGAMTGAGGDFGMEFEYMQFEGGGGGSTCSRDGCFTHSQY